MSNAPGSYYLPNPSHWPIVGSIGLFTTLLGFMLLLNESGSGGYLMIVGAVILIVMMGGWFGTVAMESEKGMYNDHVSLSFRISMMWFIFSEVMFFAGFFGALFYTRQLAVPWLAETEFLWPGFEGGWPTAGPLGPTHAGADVAAAAASGTFATIGAWGIPFWNTVILLSSSVTVTIAHHALRAGHRGKLIFWLALTVILGFTFLYFQGVEYVHAYQELNLKLSTGVYGSTFFMLTGFHGAHVTIGAIILLVVLFRCMKGHFKPENHFAFEAGAWYWHFVDVVWVGLFTFVYVL